MKAQLTVEAEDDLADAQRWYRQQSGTRTTQAFRQAVQVALDLIETYPEGHRPIYRNVRRVLLRRFPYALFYFIDGDIAVVIGCFHTARDPSVWQDRADLTIE